MAYTAKSKVACSCISFQKLPIYSDEGGGTGSDYIAASTAPTDIVPNFSSSGATAGGGCSYNSTPAPFVECSADLFFAKSADSCGTSSTTTSTTSSTVAEVGCTARNAEQLPLQSPQASSSSSKRGGTSGTKEKRSFRSLMMLPMNHKTFQLQESGFVKIKLKSFRSCSSAANKTKLNAFFRSNSFRFEKQRRSQDGDSMVTDDMSDLSQTSQVSEWRERVCMHANLYVEIIKLQVIYMYKIICQRY